MRTPEWWQPQSRRSAVVTALRPLSWLYRAGRSLHCTALRPRYAPLPLLCVGNLTAGGAGKTPLVALLAAYFTERGYRPHILARGYGGRLSSYTPLAVQPEHRAGDVGDEPLWLQRYAPVWIGRKRLRAADHARQAGADLLISDDGLQHPGLRPHLALAVLDGAYGFGNGAVLPSGPLREPLFRALARLHALVLIGPDRHQLLRHLPDHITVLRGHSQTELPPSLPAENPLLAFAGIGRPQKFFDGLRQAGATLAETVAFADHHPYRERELEALQARASALGATLITTEKDGVRLPAAWQAHIHTAPLRLSIQPPERLEALEALLNGAPMPHPVVPT